MLRSGVDITIPPPCACHFKNRLEQKYIKELPSVKMPSVKMASVILTASFNNTFNFTQTSEVINIVKLKHIRPLSNRLVLLLYKAFRQSAPSECPVLRGSLGRDKNCTRAERPDSDKSGADPSVRWQHSQSLHSAPTGIRADETFRQNLDRSGVVSKILKTTPGKAILLLLG